MKKIYKIMIKILRDQFNGTANSKEEYITKVREYLGVGRNSAIERLNELILKYKVIYSYSGGKNRTNKIITLSPELEVLDNIGTK